MKGIVLHCPNHKCQKLLMKEANIPPTTNFKIKCYHCGNLIMVMADYKGIKLKDCSSDDIPQITIL